MGLLNRTGQDAELTSVQSRKGKRSGAGRTGSSDRATPQKASWLARAAGLSQHESVESLEARQLLFSLTVTAADVDAATGLGTVQAVFGYAVPYLQSPAAQPTQAPTPQNVTENFNDEPYGGVASGGFFNDSNIQTLLGGTGSTAQVEGIAPPGDTQENQARYLRVNTPNTGSSVSFRFFSEANQQTGVREQYSVIGVTFNTRGVSQNPGNSQIPATDLTGMEISRHRVQLLYRNEVVATFEGAALLARLTPEAGTVPANGVGAWNFFVPNSLQRFDQIVISATANAPAGANISAFGIDDLGYKRIQRVHPDGNWRGAVATLSGPVGATATFADLYGRDMVRTINGSLVDANDDGVPDINGGIGSVRFTGVDSRTMLNMWGMTIEESQQNTNDPFSFFENGWIARGVAEVAGDFDELERLGFGYYFDNGATGTDRDIVGLPDVGGSLVFGSPFVRDITSGGGWVDTNGDGLPDTYNPGTFNPFGPAINGQQVTDGFARADQGFFADGGQDMGFIQIHGVVHGSSRFTGSLNTFAVGYFVGSLTVNGDLGMLSSATDAGMIAQDPNFVVTTNVTIEPVDKTGGQVIVGRTLGQVLIAGRSLLDVTVVGDVNAPATRPSRNLFDYRETEYVMGINTNANTRQVIANNLRVNPYSVGTGALLRGTSQAIVFGNTFLRNDTIAGAEYVGNASTGVRIRGEISGRDPFNQGEDKADVYAFSADGGSEIVIQGVNTGPGDRPYFRVVDAKGRTLASPRGVNASEDNRRFEASTVRFTPTDGTGVYYLVVNENGTDPATSVTNQGYSIVMTGMAATTLGAYRTGGGSGFVANNSSRANTVSVLAGSVGSVRVGMSFVGGDGANGDATDLYNTPLNFDDSASFMGGTFTAPGSLYNVTTGSDIGSNTGTGGRIEMRIGGNFGSLVTGIIGTENPNDLVTPNEGDVNMLYLTVGGTVGTMDIRGGIGMDQDQTDPRAPLGPEAGLSITTGTAGGAGNIGRIRTGFHVAADLLRINTSPGSTIGALLFSQDAYGDGDARSGLYGGERGILVRTGAGSDVRFFDAPRVDTLASADLTIPLIGDQVREFVDDSGARFSISVLNAPPGQNVGLVRIVGVDTSIGVAIASIEANLTNGRILQIAPISGSADSVISIGRITVTGDATSQINILGQAGGPQVDVLRINATGGLDAITNQSLGGDLITVDAEALNTLDIRGNLGSTQRAAGDFTNYAVRLGVSPGTTAEVGGAIGMTNTAAPDNGQGATVDNDFNGGVYRPIEDDVFDANTAYLSDLGNPVDDYANGLIVRTGNLTLARVEGSVGDVLLQGGDLLQLLVNAGDITPLGEFHGITGVVYAVNIDSVDMGDGIAGPTSESPFGMPGIYADNNIREIRSSVTGRSPVVHGAIIAANITDRANDTIVPEQADGIDIITLPNGLIDDVIIGVTSFDRFWQSFHQFDSEVFTLGDIGDLSFAGTRLFRSQVMGRDVERVNLTGGIYDASTLRASGQLLSVDAMEFRNSTLTGDATEFRPNTIIVGQAIGRVTATNDMSDLTVDVAGNVNESLQARNIIRGQYNIAGIVQSLRTTGDIRSANMGLGELTTGQVAGNLTGTTMEVSGLISNLAVQNAIRGSRIAVTGPGGRIQSITARTLFSGEVASTGPIGTLSVTNGSMDLDITTTGSTANSVQSITATGDIVLNTDIAGTLQSVTTTTGNIGSRTQTGNTILARGGIGSISAPRGQLYSDVRSGEAIQSVTVGGASAKPGADFVGRGSVVAMGPINSVTATGDFGGDIISYSGDIGNITITNGSLYLGRTVAAYGGSIQNLSVTGGNLLANVYADLDIQQLRVAADAAGTFGHVGVNPDRSAFTTTADALRNQLPVGVGASNPIVGPFISAGRDIVNINVAGSMFESGIYAKRTVQTVSVGGRIANDNFSSGKKGSFIVAGDRVNAVTVGGSIADTNILAGLQSLGADNRPGGTGANADTVKGGDVGVITSPGGTFGVNIFAGVDPGSNGVYGDDRATVQNESLDDGLALGSSSIATPAIGGTVSNTQITGDVLTPAIRADARFTSNQNAVRESIQLAKYVLDNGSQAAGTQFTGTANFSVSGATYTFTFAGPGQAFYDASARRITLRNTTSASNLTISSSSGTVTNLSVRSNDDAALGTLTVQGILTGNSEFLVDAGITTVTLTEPRFARNALNAIDTLNTPRVITGGDIANLNVAQWNGLQVTARAINSIRVTGDMGGAAETDEATVRAQTIGTVSVTGVLQALIRADQSIGNVTAGSMNRAILSAGTTLGNVSAGAISASVISGYYSVGTVNATASVFDTSISGGLDLGSDGLFDGTGTAADRLTSGSVGAVNVQGDFRESDITAGIHRGPDRFFGTADDRFAAGRATTGAVVITGTGVGSTRNSESYRIASTGTTGQVRIGGSTFTGSQGNFAAGQVATQPTPISVKSLDVTVTSGIFTAAIVFNQAMQASSLSPSLSVSEVRGFGDVEVRLIEGVDYTTSYNQLTRTLSVTFSRSVTERNLPVVAGQPAPGVYRFRFDPAILGASVARQQTDGNANGVIEVGDSYSDDAVVGDAGDKLVAERIALGDGRTADLYGPANLDFVFDNNRNPDGLPDPNRTLTINGAIGDHADNDPNFFRYAGDVDLYSITLQAGQILQLSALTGAAVTARVTLLTPAGQVITQFGQNNLATTLPVGAALADAPLNQAGAAAYLIRQTGTYIIAVGDVTTIAQPGVINNREPAFDGELGSYRLTFNIFDDGDSGFTSQTDSGNGDNIINAPAASSFAGGDGVLGTADDATQILLGGYTFRYSKGADGIANTADDSVSGSNDHGATSTIDANGRRVTTVDSAIGPAGVVGAVSRIASDVDIYHLNNRQPIAPGTKMRVTVRLSDLGADLGSLAVASNANNVGAVQFALFDTSSSTPTSGLDEADLVFSPSDFKPYGGTPNTTLADNGQTKYGYDAKGDFYIEFLAPSRMGQDGVAGTFAVYLQGVTNSAYQLEVVTDGSGTATKRTQNFFIETGGGSVDWYEAGGLTTQLGAFDLSTLGFTGSATNGQPVRDYVLSQLTSRLNSLFQGSLGTGLDVRFSTDPADFEFQPFSTIYLSNSHDPINQFFKSFSAFNFQGLFANTPFSTSQPFGASQHADPLNANLEDDAVVFVPPLGILGLGARQADIDQLTTDITGAIARRAGELMGARISVNNNTGGALPTTFDPFAADAVTGAPTGALAFSLSDTSRGLSTAQDSIERTDFFLGRQRALSLLSNATRRRS